MTDKENDNVREGAWAAAGFAVVLVIVGLPVWWHTTAVYRAALPCMHIDELAGQVNFHMVHVKILAPSSSLAADYSEAFKDVEKSKGDIRFLISGLEQSKEEKEHIRLSPSLEILEQDLSLISGSFSSNLYIYLLPDNHDHLGSAEAVVGRERIIFTKPSTDKNKLWELIYSMVIDPLSKVSFNDNYMILYKPGSNLPRTATMRQASTEPGYDITLTLMLPEPQNIIATWNPEKAIEDYLSPFVNQLKGIATLNVKSQILYMTSLNIFPGWKERDKLYVLPEDQLPLTINAIEAKLGSFVSTRPSLHFIIYVPGEKQSPLQIYSSNMQPLPSNSFLVPRWGGFMIHNPPSFENETSDLPYKFELDTHWIMTNVLTHLYKLFPIPVVQNNVNIRKLPPKDSKLAAWQVDAFSRARVSDYLSNIRTTLKSLCELVNEIDNMVVSDEVATWVWSAREEWKHCRDASREGRLQEATQYCTEAFTNADAAFFHPSMLALLYFPDNQKYAIYVPLFLPVSIPVVLSLRMIVKLFRRRNKDKVE